MSLDTGFGVIMAIRDEFITREFPMSDSNYELIQKIAYDQTGIKLSDNKKNMIYGRLARRLRQLKVSDFDQYCALILDEKNAEKKEFVNAITTNLTSFFREYHHFEFIKNIFILSILKKNKATKRIRIWSAGCSTGEEPYSIAMVLASSSALSQWDIKILATDLDSNVVNKGKEGVYGVERVEKIPTEYKRYLSIDANKEFVQVKEKIKNYITFKQLNLLNEWPMNGPFDIIFCRNVVIYFDIDTQKTLFSRYADLLAEQGNLFIGHSENLHNVTNRFKLISRTIYMKTNV